MYLGRIISLGSNTNGSYVAYRVSSRSFPNRKAVINENKIVIVPTEGSEGDIYKNPYISYNCIDIIDNKIAVVTNGAHTDIISGKIREGMNIRDSITLSLLAMDYEKDQYNTPRIAGAIDLNGNGYIGIITDSGIEVKKINPNESYYVSTYEQNVPKEVKFDVKNVKEASEFIFNKGVFNEFTHPVTSCAAFGKDKWEIDIK